ncbi:hypothetical protein D3C71_2107440 [compost metagenome]
MIQASGVTIIVAGAGKLGTRATYRIGTLAQVDHLVVAAGLPAELREQFIAGQMQLHLVPVDAA